MTELVDKLKEAVGADTDMALAKELGLERSTIAQWRRRGSLPRLYQDILDAHDENENRAMVRLSRQKLYGDVATMYLLRAALAVIPGKELEADELSPSLIGDVREQAIANVGPVIRDASEELFGRPTCSDEDEYRRLIELISSPVYTARIRKALLQPKLGVHL